MPLLLLLQSVVVAMKRADYLAAKKHGEHRLAVARENLRKAGSQWDETGHYVGSSNNIGTLLAAIAFASPLAGLLFAYMTYGSLWGLDEAAKIYFNN